MKNLLDRINSPNTQNSSYLSNITNRANSSNIPLKLKNITKKHKKDNKRIFVKFQCFPLVSNWRTKWVLRYLIQLKTIFFDSVCIDFQYWIIQSFRHNQFLKRLCNFLIFLIFNFLWKTVNYCIHDINLFVSFQNLSALTIVIALFLSLCFAWI